MPEHWNVRVSYKPGRPIPDPYEYRGSSKVTYPGGTILVEVNDGTVVQIYGETLQKKLLRPKRKKKAKTKTGKKQRS
jgi:hypothetical protein